MKYNLELVLDDDNSLQKIIKQINPNSVVLEFGPANGRMTRYLKEKLNCKVYVVEIDAEAAKDAMQYAVDGIVGDIEDFEWLKKWEHIQFDYITFADVLEHLRNPQEVLSKTKAILKNEGVAIISVPNVGHNAILLNLYNNIFEYTPLGLLDNTHTHLFAYNTLKEFCSYAGYDIVVEDGVYSFVGDNEVMASYEQVPVSLRRVLKDRKFSDVYQFVFALRKKQFTNYNEFTKVNKLLTYFPQYHFKLYYDIGDTWCEENCLEVKFKGKNLINLSIDLDDYSKISAIRIDPLNTNCVFKIQKLEIQSNDTCINYNDDNLYFNGYRINDMFICEHDDPQIIIENPIVSFKGILNITISILTYEVDKEIFDILMRHKEIFENKDKEIRELTSRLNNMEQDISKQDCKAEKLSDLNTTLEDENANLMSINNEVQNNYDILREKNKKLIEELAENRLILNNYKSDIQKKGFIKKIFS